MPPTAAATSPDTRVSLPDHHRRRAEAGNAGADQDRQRDPALAVRPRSEEHLRAARQRHVVVAYDLAEKKVTRARLPVKPGITKADWDFDAPQHGLALTRDGARSAWPADASVTRL